MFLARNATDNGVMRTSLIAVWNVMRQANQKSGRIFAWIVGKFGFDPVNFVVGIAAPG